MGIDENEFPETYKKISELPHINVCGIHAFAASGVLDYNDLLLANKYIFLLVQKMEKLLQREIRVIDFGGGLGIDYTKENKLFDVKKYGEGLQQLIKEFQLNDKEIIMELGTYIVGNAGYYTAKIIDIKRNKNKKHIVIAGGINHMGLPLEMQRMHPVYIIENNEEKLYDDQMEINKEIVDISGPLCIVNDKLSWDEYIEKASIGDIVVYCQAGAYCYAEGMIEFLLHEKPNIVVMK